MKTLVFGEILWDIFENEQAIGGAAFNFSAHLAALGGETWLLSGVGDDELGRQARECVLKQGVKTEYLRISALPTGECRVTLGKDGKPAYRLLDQTAYDDIALSGALREPMDVLYLGTLARRAAVSRGTAADLLKNGQFQEIFYDINIRKPFISREVLEEGLEYCTILKVSREEYGLLKQMELVQEKAGENAEEAFCLEVARRYPGIRLILITLDKDGAMAYDVTTQTFFYSQKPSSGLVSAVGAGDSFSACFLFNYMAGRTIPECLRRGVLLSDYVVTQTEAIPRIPEDLLRAIREE